MTKSMPTRVPGEVTAIETWRILSEKKAAVLVDVRTPEEWSVSGIPDLSRLAKEPLLLSWVFAPDRRQNPQFKDEVVSRFPEKNTPLIFMCSAGGRSGQAAEAMSQHGYQCCFNMVNGFERIDAMPKRSGWLPSGLPWKRNG